MRLTPEIMQEALAGQTFKPWHNKVISPGYKAIAYTNLSNEVAENTGLQHIKDLAIEHTQRLCREQVGQARRPTRKYGPRAAFKAQYQNAYRGDVAGAIEMPPVIREDALFDAQTIVVTARLIYWKSRRLKLGRRRKTT